ncbi:hypothetical protein CH063_13586, partial [Colletotrichum higginsianum]
RRGIITKLIAEELWESVLECVQVHPIYKSAHVVLEASVCSTYGCRTLGIRVPYPWRTGSVFLAYGSNLILSPRDLYHSSSVPGESSA